MDREEKLQKLETLLKNVSDSYSDFVEGGMDEAMDDDEYLDKVTAFIESHPNATTSDIIEYETDEIFKIPDIN